MFWITFCLLLLVVFAMGTFILGVGSILKAFDDNCVGSFILGVGLIIGMCASVAALVTIVHNTDNDTPVLAESQ